MSVFMINMYYQKLMKKSMTIEELFELYKQKHIKDILEYIKNISETKNDIKLGFYKYRFETELFNWIKDIKYKNSILNQSLVFEEARKIIELIKKDFIIENKIINNYNNNNKNKDDHIYYCYF